MRRAIPDPLSICLIIAILASPLFGERLLSPSQALALPENQVATLIAVGPGADADRYRFRQLASEEAPIELRLPEAAPKELVPGSKWWVGFSELKRQPPEPRAFMRDPDGPRVLLLEGVGLALFPATTSVGLLLDAPKEDATEAVEGERLDAALELIGAPDGSLRRLAATEFGLNTGLWPGLSPPRLAILGRAFANLSAEPYLQFRLLEGARGAAAAGVEGAAGRAVDWAREALTLASLEPDTASYEPALQIMALEVLSERGGNDDAPVVLRLLGSSHPAVGRHAVWALREVGPERLVEAAPGILASGASNAETQRVLAAVYKQLSKETEASKDSPEH